MTTANRARVKICGVTRPEDARLAASLGAAYLGLNFYRESPRCVDLDQARRIRDAVSDRVTWVGVFVDLPLEQVAELVERVGLDLVQFHGNQPLDEIRPFAARALRALRPGPEFDPANLAEYDGFWGLLLDTPDPRLFGGTGRAWDYARARPWLAGRRVLVAGGVGPSNARAVLRQLPGVFGLDVCSGVEARPGIKDPRLLARLFAELERDPEDDDGEDPS